MKQRIVFLMIGFICLTGLSRGEEKKAISPTVTIGSISWYSQEIPHEELLAIARKENKPILTVFSAVWCGPCQQMKEKAFKKNAFKTVAEKVILQYIEQTTPKGKAYCNQFAITSYPTLKIFSPKGDQLEEYGIPERTVAGFNEWIDKVKAGDHLFAARRNVKENPKDLSARIKLARLIGYYRMEEAFIHLDTILNTSNCAADFPDIYQEAMELKGKLAGHYLNQLNYERAKGSRKRPSVTTLPEYPSLKQHMEHLFECCVPDKFRFSLKKIWLYAFVNWYAMTEDHAKVIELFEKYGRNHEAVNWDKVKICIQEVMKAYGELKRIDNMQGLLAAFRKHILSDGSLAGDMGTSYAYLGAQRAVIDLFLEQKNRAEAEKHLVQLMDDLKRNGVNRHDFLLMHFYGIKEKLALPYFLPIAKATLQASTSRDRYAHYFNYGGMLSAAGQKEKAKALFVAGLEDPELIAGLPSERQALMKAQMVHGLADNDIFDAEALRVGEALLEKQKTPSTLSAVSKLKAGMGDTAGAVRLLEEARSLETDPKKKAGYEKRIADLKAK